MHGQVGAYTSLYSRFEGRFWLQPNCNCVWLVVSEAEKYVQIAILKLLQLYNCATSLSQRSQNVSFPIPPSAGIYCHKDAAVCVVCPSLHIVKGFNIKQKEMWRWKCIKLICLEVSAYETNLSWHAWIAVNNAFPPICSACTPSLLLGEMLAFMLPLCVALPSPSQKECKCNILDGFTFSTVIGQAPTVADDDREPHARGDSFNGWSWDGHSNELLENQIPKEEKCTCTTHVTFAGEFCFYKKYKD